jgi:hypothetical protein
VSDESGWPRGTKSGAARRGGKREREGEGGAEAKDESARGGGAERDEEGSGGVARSSSCASE